MSILWCGGEDIDFPNGTAPAILTTGSSFDSAYARCSIRSPAIAAYVKSVAFTPVTSCWLSGQIVHESTQSGGHLFGLMYSGTGSSGLYIGGGTPYQQLTLVKWDGTTSTLLAAETGTSFVFGILLKIDIQIINYGASATVNVWVDGVLVITYTGDVTVSGVTSLDTVVLSSDAGGSAYASEIIVADQDTRTLRLATLAPAGAGTTDAWTGAYTDVNEVVLNDATSVYTNATSQDEEFTLSTLPAGAVSIVALKAGARCSATAGSTPTNIAVGIRSGGTTSAGTPVGQTTAWTENERLMGVNPVTGLAWTQSAVNALQINLRSS